MNSPKLSIVIPAYNESKNIASGVLTQVDEYLKKQDYTYEVLIVDDGSTDDTVEVAEKVIKGMKNFSVVKNPHGGKALTVLSGMLQTKGEVALFTDMDQATPIDQLEKLLPKFEDGNDIVIGSRSGRKGAPLIRKFIAFGFALSRNIILGLPFKDTQCGFKAFTHHAIEQTFPQMVEIWSEMKAKKAAVNAGFDVELLYLAKKKNLKIAEVPVQWHYVGTERVQAITDSIEALKDMLRIRQNDLSGKYH
jgi:dolichyl-phosphate beta-glucosyltransferase